MNIKNITASSLLTLTIIFLNTIYADVEITENNNQETITKTTECNIDNPVTITKEESFELLLQKYLDSNQIKKETLIKKIKRITGREVSLLTLTFLIIPVTTFIQDIADRKGIFESLKNLTYFKTVFTNRKEFISIASIILPLYIIFRSSYAVAQYGTTQALTPNLNLLTEIVKLWKSYKSHVPEELHQTLDLLHKQYLINKKLNMNETIAQTIINEMLKISFNNIKEDSTAITV